MRSRRRAETNRSALSPKCCASVVFRFSLHILLLLAAACLTSCGTGKDLSVAQQAVEQFRRQLAAEQDDVIYDAADATWRAAIDRETSHKFFARLRRKLGSYGQSQNTGFNVNFSTTGTFVALRFKTRCANGELDENFTWRVSGGHAFLTGYNVVSPLLLSD